MNRHVKVTLALVNLLDFAGTDAEREAHKWRNAITRWDAILRREERIDRLCAERPEYATT